MRFNSALLAAGAVMALTTGCSHVSADTFFGTDSRTIVMSDSITTYHVKTLDEFSTVDVSRPVRVEYETSATRHAVIHAGHNVMDSVYCFVKDNTLRIGLHGRNVNYCNTEKLTITVYGPETLAEIKTSAGARFAGKNFKGNSFTLRASSGSDLTVGNVTAIDLRVNTSSSGDVRMGSFDGQAVSINASSSGDAYADTIKAIDINCNASSSGDIKIGKFDGTKATLSVSSSGDAVVNRVIAVNVEAHASSGGDVKIDSLDGTTLDVRASSGGDVKVRQLRVNNVYTQASSGGDVVLSGRAHTVKASASSGGSIKTSGLTADNFESDKSSGGRVSR